MALIGSSISGSLAGSATLYMTGTVNLVNDAVGPGELRFLEDTDHGTQYVSLKAPDITGSYTMTLPTSSAAENDYVLKSTTAGVLSWAEGGGGSARSVAGDTDNALISYVNSGATFAAEANLTFDGSTLAVAGAITSTGASTYGSLSGGALSGSSTLKTDGAITTAGALNVTGTITAAGIASGSIAGPGSYIGLNTNNQLVLTSSAGGGSTSPGGSNYELQYNNAGAFGGIADLQYNSQGAGDFLIASSSGDSRLNFRDYQIYMYSPSDGELEIGADGRISLVGAVSGSSTLTAVGATELKSTLAVSGAITAAGIASGSIAGAGSYVGLNSSNQLVLTSSSGGGGGVAIASGDSDNYVMTSDGTGDSLVGEANLTYDGTDITLNDDVKLGGGIRNYIAAATTGPKLADYTLTTADYYVPVKFVSGSAGITLTLPDCSSRAGQTYVIKNVTTSYFTGSVTIDAHSSHTIDGETTIKLETPYSSVTLIASGSAWSII